MYLKTTSKNKCHTQIRVGKYEKNKEDMAQIEEKGTYKDVEKEREQNRKERNIWDTLPGTNRRKMNI